MKVLFINGSPDEKNTTYAAIEEVASTLKTKNIDSEIVWLGKAPIADCIDCGTCSKTHKCIYSDLVNITIEKMKDFDGLVIASPVYYSGPTGRIQSFLDRFFYACPEEYLCGKVGASLTVYRRGGNTATFERLNQYFLMNNMFVIGSQYWNMAHGFTYEDAKKDKEGMQTMRRLAFNMAYVLECIEAGKEKGITYPTLEKKREVTNFMDGK